MSHLATSQQPAADAAASPRDWGTIAQAAGHYGVSRDTIRRMISRGEVYAERVGPRLIRVDMGSILTRPIHRAS